MKLRGWVKNTAAGVEIEVEGQADDLQAFFQALRQESPPLARVDGITATAHPPRGYQDFTIQHSQSQPGDFIPISPDVAICPDCLDELFDPADRRYRYPFINCTNCGPRFTIIEGIPYDRPQTTMKSFPLCAACAAEYHDPRDRRFHAQPVACADCGPRLWLEVGGQEVLSGEAALLETQRRIAGGEILAIKGLGGFHLACDATNPAAVAELRRRKLRVDKPFALMMLDAAAVAAQCLLSDEEQALLESRARPIVILRRRTDARLCAALSPGQDTAGVMLPYTPLHYLLLHDAARPGAAWVMTSANLSEEPIATHNEEARQRLGGIADAFLMHNRAIRTRCDDSVARLAEAGRPLLLRRGRGYAPQPVRLPFEAAPVLAAGAELKNTFCLGRGRYAFLSQHIGDLENDETLQAYEDSVAHLEALFRVQPEVIAHDLHPDYLATRYALERAARQGLPAVGVQHHHAHIAACMADNGLDGKRAVIGVAFDGVGYGEDGLSWGGEFLLADYRGFRRAAHLAYIPLPGGDLARREVWRLALAWLWQCGLPWEEVAWLQTASPQQAQAAQVVRRQLEKGLNAPLSSSMGRLFDAAAALAGVRQAVNYEGQAAIEFEALVAPEETGAYPFAVAQQEGMLILDPAALFGEMLADLRARRAAGVIAARFHNGVAEMVAQVAGHLRDEHGIEQAALSGGVWQNATLLNKTVACLQRAGLGVLLHRQVPPNDGGVALGQAVIALHAQGRPAEG